MGETSNAYGILKDKPIRGCPLGRPRIEDNILNHDHAQWQKSVTVLLQLQHVASQHVSSPFLTHVSDFHPKMIASTY